MTIEVTKTFDHRAGPHDSSGAGLDINRRRQQSVTNTTLTSVSLTFSNNAGEIGTDLQEPNRATGLKHVNWYY